LFPYHLSETILVSITTEVRLNSTSQ